MPKEKKYVLEMNEEQALMVEKALEFYARMGIGQWNMVGENFLDLRDEMYCEKKKDLDHRMEKSRRIVFPDLPHTLAASLGIRAVEKAALAWELYTVIRHRMAWTNNPEGGYGCHYDKPISFSGRELAKCDVVYPSEQVTEAFIEKTLAEINLREKAGQETILLEIERTKKVFEELKKRRKENNDD